MEKLKFFYRPTATLLYVFHVINDDGEDKDFQHEELYKTKDNKYVLVDKSSRKEDRDQEELSNEEAASWKKRCLDEVGCDPYHSFFYTGNEADINRAPIDNDYNKYRRCFRPISV